MSTTASALVQKVWNYAHVLKDDGLAFMDYTEQITFLLFLRMAHEREAIGSKSAIPEKYNWAALSKESGEKLEIQYSKTLRELGKQTGLLGVIFAKAQNRITDPAKLERLISMIEGENWSGMDVDVKGEIYEGLLARNAEDVRGGAGQYFTPRPVIRAIVQVMRPEPTMHISDPACGTGGFLLAAYEYLVKTYRDLDRKAQTFINEEAIHGNDIVPNVTRLCAMNLYLHGMGGDKSLVTTSDSLSKKPAPVEMVLTNPPFGKKSSITAIGEDGKLGKEKIYVERNDFWTTTSNKQLNFLQHAYAMLTDTGRAAVVVPDNVLFEAGAGEKIRRNLLKHCDVHTLLRLPTGIWYSPGVKANVLFFDKHPAAKTQWTKELWVYDLRTNKNFTLRQNTIADDDLKDFVQCYQTAKRTKRQESKRFKRFTYDDLMARDKANLDIAPWIKDDSLADTENLPAPKILAREIIEDLEEALEEFSAVEEELNGSAS